MLFKMLSPSKESSEYRRHCRGLDSAYLTDERYVEVTTDPGDGFYFAKKKRNPWRGEV